MTSGTTSDLLEGRVHAQRSHHGRRVADAVDEEATETPHSWISACFIHCPILTEGHCGGGNPGPYHIRAGLLGFILELVGPLLTPTPQKKKKKGTALLTEH